MEENSERESEDESDDVIVEESQFRRWAYGKIDDASHEVKTAT